MIILGIDPGTRRVGYGIILKEGNDLSLVDAGLLKIESETDAEALVETRAGISKLLKKHNPEVCSIEKIFFSKNQKTAIAVAQARGAIVLSAQEAGVLINEYTPTEIKSCLTGNGGADKEAVFKMVKLILKTPDLKLIDDASDALAVAITSAQKAGFE